jgi:hypothetical protein
MDDESFIKALENLIITLEWYFANWAPSGKLL